MTDARLCPRCGAELPPDESECPACLIELAVAETGHGSGAPPSELDFSIEDLAQRFPHLEIIELLGRGGMGAVYKARQSKLNRFVALKILPPRLGREVAFADRFEREAQALAQLNHPNIVVVYDFGEAEGLYYLMMEYVDGVNLRQSLQSGHLAADQALTIVPQICDALQFAHDEGVVHRDIKPENILLDRRGRVKIADFGLAKLCGDAAADQKQLTISHQVMGTLHYMAPEQMQSPLDVDHRADIYSLGVVFYELLTGQLPIGRFDPPSERSGVSTGLDEVVLRTLQQQPDKRYQRASDVKTGIESAARNSRSPAAEDSEHGGSPQQVAATFRPQPAAPSEPAFTPTPPFSSRSPGQEKKPPVVRKPPMDHQPQSAPAGSAVPAKLEPLGRQPEITVVTVLLWLSFFAGSMALNSLARNVYSPVLALSTVIWLCWGLLDATALSGIVVWLQQRRRGLRYPAFGGEHVWRLSGWVVLVWMFLRVPLLIVQIVEAQGGISDSRVTATVGLALLIVITIFHGLGALIVAFMIREPRWRVYTAVLALANVVRVAAFIMTIVGMWAGVEMVGGFGTVTGVRALSAFPLIVLLIVLGTDLFDDQRQSWTHWTGGSLELAKLCLFLVPTILTLLSPVV